MNQQTRIGREEMADEAPKEAAHGLAPKEPLPGSNNNSNNANNSAPLMLLPSPSSSSSAPQPQQTSEKEQNQSQKNPPPGISRIIERSDEPRSLQELLKWCVQHQGEEGEVQEMNAERKAWLQEALKSLNVDTVEILKNNITKFENPDANVQETIEGLDQVNEIIQDLDNSRDLYILGGLRPVLALLSHGNDSIRSAAAELLATSVQNHPQCQTMAFEGGALDRLVSLLGTEQATKVKAKLIRALSCLIRGHGPLHEAFLIQHDGISLLSKILQTTGDTVVQTKLVYMLTNLCIDPAVKERVAGLSVAETVVSILEANLDCEECIDLIENSFNLLLCLAEDPKSLPSLIILKSAITSVTASRREFIKRLPKEEQVRHVEEVVFATKLNKLLA